MLNQYDYSGKNLIAQIPIVLQVNATNNVISGQFIFNNSQTIPLQAIQQGNQLLFSQTSMAQAKTKTQTKASAFIFKSANLQHQTKNDTSYLTGTLLLFNNYTLETDKPINLTLTQPLRSIKTIEKQETNNKVLVYPNPTKSAINIAFALASPSPVKIIITNMRGQVVYTKVFSQLPQGKQSLSFALPQWQNGIYLLKLESNRLNQTTAFIKE